MSMTLREARERLTRNGIEQLIEEIRQDQRERETRDQVETIFQLQMFASQSKDWMAQAAAYEYDLLKEEGPNDCWPIDLLEAYQVYKDWDDQNRAEAAEERRLQG